MAPKVLIKSPQTPRCDIYPRTTVKVQPKPAPIKIKRVRGNFTINEVRDCETVTTKL